MIVEKTLKGKPSNKNEYNDKYNYYSAHTILTPFFHYIFQFFEIDVLFECSFVQVPGRSSRSSTQFTAAVRWTVTQVVGVRQVARSVKINDVVNGRTPSTLRVCSVVVT